MDVPGTFHARRTLKADLLGRVEEGTWTAPDGSTVPAARRDVRGCPWWTRTVARRLLAREARALAAIDGVPGVPRLLHRERDRLVRGWIAGRALHEAGDPGTAWFGEARRLLVRLHRRGVTHNDTAKEPNWLVAEDGSPALVDFQLAAVSPRRGRLFRTLAREDLRHLLKHKRTYRRDELRPRERALLAAPSGGARALRRLAKPVYNVVTRRLLGWQDREGRGPPAP